jgi:microcystin-dependent protein
MKFVLTWKKNEIFYFYFLSILVILFLMSLTISNNFSSSEYYDLLVRVQTLEEQMLLTYNTSAFIQADALATGRVDNAKFDTLRDIITTETIQAQLNNLADQVKAAPTFNENSTITELEYLTLNNIDTSKTIQTQINGIQTQINSINSTSTVSSVAPSGTVFIFAGTDLPTGYLLCDGTAYQQSQYANLYKAIGHTYRYGRDVTFNIGGVNTRYFYVPDLRQCYVKGAGNNGTFGEITAETASLGVFQEQSVQIHTHQYIDRGTDTVDVNSTTTAGKTDVANDSHDTFSTLSFSMGDQFGNDLPANETRPNTLVMHYIIKV